MKKIVLLVVMVVAVIGASAQINWGVKVGANGANVNAKEQANPDMKFSVYVGAFAEFSLSEKFAIQPEAVYSRQGFQEKYEGETMKARLNYINVPILAKYYILDKWSVEAGPQFGFMLNAKAVSKVDGKTATESMKDAFKSFEFSVGVGTSYKFTDKIGVSFRYNIGISDIAKKVDGESFNMHNNVMQLGAFYCF